MSNIRVKIIQDMDSESPRGWDNLGTMACWHRRYNLGDVQPSESPEEYLANLPEDSIVLPLYLYDHSGITMSTSGFSCPWDSGQVGVIHVSPERIRAEYGDDSPESREQARKVLESEVKVYDQYLTGDVWGFVAEEIEGCSECGSARVIDEDSCWGFYGLDVEAMRDYLDSKFHEALEKAAESPGG